jgi:S-formylglutathione hydrolase FrmB
MRLAAAVLILTAVAPSARGQLLNWVDLDHLNRKLAGRVVDYTHNHGADRRIPSAILGRPRDLYVYLPPGYTPTRAYPVVLYLHSASVDEHYFLGPEQVVELDGMICSGLFPPAIVASPDGLADGRNRRADPHTFFLNGRLGRFEDHLLYEVMPFLAAHYSIRPEPAAHALLGISGGGLGAASIAMRHPDVFGVVAVVSSPLNPRYTTCTGDVRADFDPATFRWKTSYDPDEIVGVFNFGLRQVPARKHIAPAFGDDPAEVFARVQSINPADLLFTASPQPGRPAIFAACGGRDNWNFDAQTESFLWLAKQRGFPVDSYRGSAGRHALPFFHRGEDAALCWLAGLLPPPAEPGAVR